MFKVAVSERAREHMFPTDREIVDARSTDFVDVSSVVVMADERDIIDRCNATKFGIPVFVMTDDPDSVEVAGMEDLYHIVDLTDRYNERLCSRELDTAAAAYEDAAIPPFFKQLLRYTDHGNLQFDTPGHHGGQYFRKSPAGRVFYDFYGEDAFRSDYSSSDVDMGDILTEGGPALEALQHAAKVYNADKTYFVTNGTTTSNNIVINAAVAPGDLVLFDRNNHKSVYNQALVKSGGRPVYLQTSRDPYGF
ncbi:MAG: hypothetical protein IJG77_03745, partial [Aeriscardovia sp.]|nr:hypothetical protein [Aeriscardovia sp.]